MIGADKERLITFKNRIKQLELQLEEKNELLNQYEAIGNAADQKISAINSIHSDKIRSLMNSIQLLKKENARLKDLTKEHKRSQLIEQLNAEVRDQDTVINALKELVNDESRSDNAIIKALNQGPPKIKSLTREELKIENKKLSNQILSLKQQLEKGKIVENNSNVSKASTEQSKSQIQNTSQAGEDEPSKLGTNDNLIRRIEELKNENDELKLNLKAEEDIRTRYEEEINRRGLELIELRSAKTELIVMNKKYEYVQRQVEQLKAFQASKEVNLMNAELEKEEIQIINKAQTGKLKAAEKNLRVEVDSLATKTEQAVREKEEIQNEYQRVLVRYDDLSRRFNELQSKFLLQREEVNKARKEIETKTSYYEKQIQTLLSDKSKLQEDISNRDSLIVEANLKIENLTKQNEEITQGLAQLQQKLHRISIFIRQIIYQKEDLDENEKEIDKRLQEIMKKKNAEKNNGTSEEIARNIQILREHYEKIISELQKKLLLTDKKYAAEIENISSSVSKLIEKQSELGDQLEEMDSDISGSIFKKQQLYGGHYGLIKNEQVENLSSNIEDILDSEERKVSVDYENFDSQVSIQSSIIQAEENILKAPKKIVKDQSNVKSIAQLNSSVSQLSQTSKQNQEIDAMSSNISRYSLQSQISSSQKSKVFR